MAAYTHFQRELPSEDTIKCNSGTPCKYRTLQYQANSKVLITFNTIICIRGCKLQHPEKSKSMSCKKEKFKKHPHHIKNEFRKKYFSCLSRGTQGPPFFVKIKIHNLCCNNHFKLIQQVFEIHPKISYIYILHACIFITRVATLKKPTLNKLKTTNLAGGCRFSNSFGFPEKMSTKCLPLYSASLTYTIIPSQVFSRAFHVNLPAGACAKVTQSDTSLTTTGVENGETGLHYTFSGCRIPITKSLHCLSTKKKKQTPRKPKKQASNYRKI